MKAEKMTYTDFDGTERTETFYFDLSKSELADMQMTTEGGLDIRLQRIIDAKDGASIMRTIRSLILKAYGEKSDDGRYLMKSDEISHRFSCSRAFDQLYMDLITDAKKAAAWIKEVIPPMPDNAPAMSVPNK